jgi:plastocyanin
VQRVQQSDAGGFIAFVVGLVVMLVIAGVILAAAGTSSGSTASAPQPAATSAAASPAGGGTPAAGGSPAAGAPVAGGPGTTIAATEKEYAIALDKSSVPAGNVTFDVHNTGSLPHTIAVTPGDGASKAKGVTGTVIGDSGNIDAGKTGTLTVALQPGTYQVVCTVPGHVQLGMIVQLTVT